MINKVAEQVREAEVRGVMAAFVDAGLVKMASETEFDNVCSTVAANLGDNYDLETVAQVADAVLSGQTKTASETARNAALGELLIMKTAGQIDDATFRREAGALMKTAGAGKAVADAFRAGGLRRALSQRSANKAFLNTMAQGKTPGLVDTAEVLRRQRALKRSPLDIAKGIGQAGAAYGGAAAALGGAGALGKSLYDKYAQ